MTCDCILDVGHAFDFQILLHIASKAMIIVLLPDLTNSVGMLSTPGDFPCFSDSYCICNFFLKDRVSDRVGCMMDIPYVL